MSREAESGELPVLKSPFDLRAMGRCVSIQVILTCTGSPYPFSERVDFFIRTGSEDSRPDISRRMVAGNIILPLRRWLSMEGSYTFGVNTLWGFTWSCGDFSMVHLLSGDGGNREISSSPIPFTDASARKFLYIRGLALMVHLPFRRWS